jgi:hypothetical protein
VTSVRIIGVHPIMARESCDLIEVGFHGDPGGFAWDSVTQESPGQPEFNWQVAYDETPLNDDGTRWAFFFHYLDVLRPLLTSVGPLDLPARSPLPSHLQHLEYEEP